MALVPHNRNALYNGLKLISQNRDYCELLSDHIYYWLTLIGKIKQAQHGWAITQRGYRVRDT